MGVVKVDILVTTTTVICGKKHMASRTQPWRGRLVRNISTSSYFLSLISDPSLSVIVKIEGVIISYSLAHSYMLCKTFLIRLNIFSALPDAVAEFVCPAICPQNFPVS